MVKLGKMMWNAIVKALRFAKSNPLDKVLQAVPPEYYAGDKETYRAALAKAIEAYSADGRFSAEGAQTVYGVLKRFEPSVLTCSFCRRTLPSTIPSRRRGRSSRIYFVAPLLSLVTLSTLPSQLQ